MGPYDQQSFGRQGRASAFDPRQLGRGYGQPYNVPQGPPDANAYGGPGGDANGAYGMPSQAQPSSMGLQASGGGMDNAQALQAQPQQAPQQPQQMYEDARSRSAPPPQVDYRQMQTPGRNVQDVRSITDMQAEDGGYGGRGGYGGPSMAQVPMRGEREMQQRQQAIQRDQMAQRRGWGPPPGRGYGPPQGGGYGGPPQGYGGQGGGGYGQQPQRPAPAPQQMQQRPAPQAQQPQAPQAQPQQQPRPAQPMQGWFKGGSSF